MKLKALGLGLLAMLAMSATAVMNAGAETGGHIVSEVGHTELKGEDKFGQTVELVDHHANKGIKCAKNPTYTGTMTTPTVTSVTITPDYNTTKECTDLSGNIAHIKMNGCNYTFTVNTKPSTTHNTVHLTCPEGKVIEIEITAASEPCIITVKAQSPSGGVTYTTAGSGTTHSITADVTVTGIHMEYHGGFFTCLVPHTTTSTTATLIGKVQLNGFKGGVQVGITAK